MNAEDFVNVKLTARGEQIGPVMVAGGDHQKTFEAGKSYRVPRAEFVARYEFKTDVDGAPLFEIEAE